MTKQHIDKLFTASYPDLLNYCKGSVKYHKRSIDPLAVLSECYLYVQSRASRLKKDSDVIAYSKTYIKNNLGWYNSPLMRQETIRMGQLEIIDNLVPDKHSLGTGKDPEAINIEFYNSLSAYDKRLFNIFYNLNLQKGREIAEYLKVSLSAAFLIKKECTDLEDKYRRFVKQKAAI